MAATRRRRAFDPRPLVRGIDAVLTTLATELSAMSMVLDHASEASAPVGSTAFLAETEAVKLLVHTLRKLMPNCGQVSARIDDAVMDFIGRLDGHFGNPLPASELTSALEVISKRMTTRRAQLAAQDLVDAAYSNIPYRPAIEAYMNALRRSGFAVDFDGRRVLLSRRKRKRHQP